MIRLRDIDPAKLADQAHATIQERVTRLASQIGAAVVLDAEAHASRAHEVANVVHERTGDDALAGRVAALSPPTGTWAEVRRVRRVVHALAHYALGGEPPEGRHELVGEYLQSLVDADLVPDLDVDPDTELHAVVLAALARDRLHRDQPVPSTWLAVLGGVGASMIRHLLHTGELRRWKRGVGDDRRVHVHPEDARRWLDARGR